MRTKAGGIIIMCGSVLSCALLLCCFFITIKLQTSVDPISLYQKANLFGLLAQRVLCGSVFAGFAADILHNKKRKV